MEKSSFKVLKVLKEALCALFLGSVNIQSSFEALTGVGMRVTVSKQTQWWKMSMIAYISDYWDTASHPQICQNKPNVR